MPREEGQGGRHLPDWQANCTQQAAPNAAQHAAAAAVTLHRWQAMGRSRGCSAASGVLVSVQASQPARYRERNSWPTP